MTHYKTGLVANVNNICDLYRVQGENQKISERSTVSSEINLENWASMAE